MLPSLFILIALSWIYMAYGQVPAIAGMLYGIKPAVTAIVLHAAWRIGSRALKSRCACGRSPLRRSWRSSPSTVPFPAIVLAAGRARRARRQARTGAIRGRRRRTRAGGSAHAPAIIDDDTPTPKHALFRVVATRGGGRRRPGRSGAMASARSSSCFGAETPLTQMGWFFTKAALLTFGGAYAVLPYVVPGRGRDLRLAHAAANDRRAGARRDDARAR